MTGGASDPSGWAELEEALAEVLAVHPDDQLRVLSELEGRSPGLGERLAPLLAALHADPDFLESSIGAPPESRHPQSPLDSPPPGYQIVALLGEGGMGRVFRAIRERDGVQQAVALKLLRTRSAVHRELFLRERRTLARLQHPGIVPFLDAGTTPDGMPWLAMELVDGEPITHWVRRTAPPFQERIGLVRQLCAAVQYGHTNLVVHRDLKPSNVLVTSDGHPRLLDFGIAAILADGESAPPPALTPGYAAPEQLRGEPVTAAADVHALGILLYEVVAGHHPFRPDGDEAPEVVRKRILDGGFSPIPPSGSIPADLTAILLKALSVDPARRYDSAAALGDDLRRLLEGQPVEAVPDSAGYRFRRFAGRNRWTLVASAVAVGVLLASTGLALYQAHRIQGESRRAVTERDKAVEVRTFLLEAFGGSGFGQGGDPVSAQELLDRQLPTLERSYGDRPELHAEMLEVLAEAYERIGRYDRAEELARGAVEIQETLDPSSPQSGGAQATLGWILHQGGHLQESEASLTRALGILDNGDPAFHPRLARTLNDLGVVAEAAQRYDDASGYYARSLELRRGLPGEALGAAITSSNLSVIHYRRGELDAAVELALQSLAGLDSVLGPSHPRSILVRSNLAAFRTAAGDREGAARDQRAILAQRIRSLGEDHPDVHRSRANLASALLLTGEIEEPRRLAGEALEGLTRSLGDDHPELVFTLETLGDARRLGGDTEGARAAWSRGLAIARRRLPPGHPRTVGLERRLTSPPDDG